jgi:predicted GH43/DUF377 family glycosyl hydrolase
MERPSSIFHAVSAPLASTVPVVLGLLLTPRAASAQTGTVSPEESNAVDAAAMQRIYEAAKTPFKYGVVLEPPAGKKVDCPNVFRRGDRWFMIYVQLETDPQGYTTQLATSDDLLHWKPLGPILTPGKSGTWDQANAGGGIALIDHRWDGSWELEKYDGKYWLSYLGGAKPGYETPPLSVGLAWTTDPSAANDWTRLPENPVLSSSDSDARPFEADTLFKSHILRDPDRTLGAEFVMFYNARKPRDSERIGMAVSDDMKHWRRYGDGPVVANERPSGLTHGVISGDPQIVKIDDLWVMFYFGAFWKPGAFDTFAASRDLVHWTKWAGPDLIAPSEPWDKTFAHKPWLVRHDGVVYHFYCAVGNRGRVIALATSKDLSTPKAK